MTKKKLRLLIGLVCTVIALIFGGLSIKEAHAPVNKPTPTFFQPISTSSGTLGAESRVVLVTKVVDGDTIEIEGGQRVRYIGIDTPETVDPRRPVGCFGKEASRENKNLVEGGEVILVKDVSETDKYERLLRYVYIKTEDGSLLFVNDYLVRAGFAKASTYPPDVRFTEQFTRAEQEARENNRGLWGRC